jgi:hypothetical protein
LDGCCDHRAIPADEDLLRLSGHGPSERLRPRISSRAPLGNERCTDADADDAPQHTGSDMPDASIRKGRHDGSAQEQRCCQHAVVRPTVGRVQHARGSECRQQERIPEPIERRPHRSEGDCDAVREQKHDRPETRRGRCRRAASSQLRARCGRAFKYFRQGPHPTFVVSISATSSALIDRIPRVRKNGYLVKLQPRIHVDSWQREVANNSPAAT